MELDRAPSSTCQGTHMVDEPAITTQLEMIRIRNDEIAARRSSGEPWQAIATWLSAQGVKGHNGNALSARSVGALYSRVAREEAALASITARTKQIIDEVAAPAFKCVGADADTAWAISTHLEKFGYAVS